MSRDRTLPRAFAILVSLILLAIAIPVFVEAAEEATFGAPCREYEPGPDPACAERWPFAFDDALPIVLASAFVFVAMAGFLTAVAPHRDADGKLQWGARDRIGLAQARWPAFIAAGLLTLGLLGILADSYKAGDGYLRILLLAVAAAAWAAAFLVPSPPSQQAPPTP